MVNIRNAHIIRRPGIGFNIAYAKATFSAIEYIVLVIVTKTVLVKPVCMDGNVNILIQLSNVISCGKSKSLF